MDTNVLYCNNNADRLASFPDESVDLVYLDPPFFSNRTYEVIWGDEAEVRSFEDRFAGGITHYVEWMRERIVELHRVLKSTGSIYVHCDWHANSYLRVMMDEVFGYRQFRNELGWHYSGWNKKMARHYERRRDSILFYGKSDGQFFAAPTVPWDSEEQYLKVRKQKVYEEADGRRYVMSDAGGGQRVRRYLDEAMAYGRPIDDTWEIDKLNNSAKERRGYPTQKPEPLLERIIQASSREGDVVLDPFCGCGTTVAVADRLGRRWVGIDISPTAMEIMKRRLWNQTRQFPRIVDMPDNEARVRELAPFEFQNWVINALNGTHNPRKTGDMGIDGYWFLTRDPIQVKKVDRVGREAIDTFETAVRRAGHDTGYFVAFSFTRGAHEEVARAKRDGLHIKLINVKEILLLVKRPEDALSLASKYGPQPDEDALPGTVAQLPMPALRKSSEMPSVEQLVASAG
ncbi:MAG TPA: DNA methyltransferase [Iamia sp.]|nr:DNA methyltransferase [Iamia sp.]